MPVGCVLCKAVCGDAEHGGGSRGLHGMFHQCCLSFTSCASCKVDAGFDHWLCLSVGKWFNCSLVIGVYLLSDEDEEMVFSCRDLKVGDLSEKRAMCSLLIVFKREAKELRDRINHKEMKVLYAQCIGENTFLVFKGVGSEKIDVFQHIVKILMRADLS